MPKSRGRRKGKKTNVRRGSGRRGGLHAPPMPMPSRETLLATDAAEARGDARAAFDLIEQDLAGRGDEGARVWRRERMRRLVQIVVLESVLPRWAVSRWVVAQAAQWLDPRARSRLRVAMKAAGSVRAPFPLGRPADELGAQMYLLDHDWVFRQLLLYDLGTLELFVAHGAEPQLVERADRVSEWAATPMGAFRLLQEAPTTLEWLDLRSGEQVRSLNLGATAFTDVGDCVIGRLVPIEGATMFESAPLPVPLAVAERVAAEPTGWLAAVADACVMDARPVEERILTTRSEFALLTDVPLVLRQLATEVVVGDRDEDVRDRSSADAWVTDQLELVRAALDDELPEEELPCSVWPSVAATLLEPSVLAALPSILRTGDGPRLMWLADRLSEPASTVCEEIAVAYDFAA